MNNPVYIYFQNQFTHMCDMKMTVILIVFVILYVWIGSHSSSILTFNVFVFYPPPRRSSHRWPKHVGIIAYIIHIQYIFLQIWCDFDRVSSLICGNKMPTRCNRGFYCRSYCLLNMFRAPLCPSSGAQEYYTVVAACGISCCGFSSSWSGVELRVMRTVCRMLLNQHPANWTHNPYAYGLQDVGKPASCKPDA